MYKLIAFLLLIGFVMLLHALQADEEIALQALFQGKRSVNRAAHAAAQQIDMQKHYLQSNLRLDASNEPLPGTFWRSRAEVLVFEVINEDRTFPYMYANSAYDYSVTLQKPGVIMIVRLEYPRTYTVLGPVTWEIKGAAELIY
ncbi:MAG: hypothetical protein K0Q94_4649 [Paenibacillus sp.]|nr:hypothetical protein [Paenibacillus sp.]